ncbi:MAG: methionine--tRNA ligase subunit beta [Patescibacteria group bacterium]|nr:methionine--tRNA ligase subunit beta [Patescibacteria group bacterium]MCL5261818.1 methionine--tRNA ligase subunit beta [Patescibacteria group bacterium]
MINIDDFKKIELKVAKIIAAERIAESEKLLKLKVSLGDEERQVLAGIAKYYDPEGLVGREIVMVANLEPRSLAGYESQGMLLAATDIASGEPVIISPVKETAPGSGIK